MEDDPSPSSVPPTSPEELSGHYRRGEPSAFGSADRLQALSDGYFGLNWVFLVNVVLVIGLRAATAFAGDATVGIILLLGAIAVILAAVAILSYPHNRRIAYGKGWDPSAAMLASVLMGLNSALCCGIIGYVVMQQIASVEMKKYGIPTGFFGIRKAVVAARVAQLRAQENPRGFQI